MSYMVLARKWRPRAFPEMVGQEHVVKALVNALDSGRLHHAFLFSGTRGVGKTTIARILAKALNCESGVSAEPCGSCAACREIDEGRFVDLIEVDAASRTKVDDTRELLENVQYAPARGRFKVYLIDEVHMLSNHSFNALLKTLEEPPPHVKFLLATTDPQKLPVTVLSRCLQFNLKRLPASLIRDRLAQIVKEEGVEAEPAALQLVSRAADGSMRDALSLLDQLIAYGDGKLVEHDVSQVLGSLDTKQLSRLLRALAENDARALMDQVAAMDELVPDYAGVLEDVAELLHHIALIQAVPDMAESLAENDGLAAELASVLSPEDVQLYYQISLIGRRDLDLAPDPRVGFEMVLLRMLAFKPGAADEQPTPAPSAARRPNKPASAAPTHNLEGVAAAQTRAPERADRGNESDWRAIVESLDVVGATKELAANCVLIKREGKTLHLQLDAASEHMLTKQLKEKLRQALEARYQEPLKVAIEVCEPRADTPARRMAKEEGERLQEAKDAIQRDPNVRALQETFDATVQADSIRPVK